MCQSHTGRPTGFWFLLNRPKGWILMNEYQSWTYGESRRGWSNGQSGGLSMQGTEKTPHMKRRASTNSQWTGSEQVKFEGLCKSGNKSSGSHKRWEISWSTKRILVAQEFCLMKLVLKLSKFSCGLRLHKDRVTRSPVQGRHSNIVLYVNKNL